MSLTDRINELFDSMPDLDNVHLASALHVTRATVTEWRGGKTKELKPKHGFPMAEYFGVNPKWLMLGIGKKYLNAIQEKAADYEITARDLKEKQALLIFRSMADFQQDEWLAEGQEKVDLFNKFNQAKQIAEDM